MSKKIGEARLRWLGLVEGKTGEDVIVGKWEIEVSGHRKKGRPKLRWSDFKQRHAGDRISERRSTILEDSENENLMLASTRHLLLNLLVSLFFLFTGMRVLSKSWSVWKAVC